MFKKSQIDKLKGTARGIGADADQAKFDEALRKMVTGTDKEAKEAMDELADMFGQNDSVTEPEQPRKPRNGA